jgi:hypothetical protein
MRIPSGSNLKGLRVGGDVVRELELLGEDVGVGESVAVLEVLEEVTPGLASDLEPI